MKRLLFCFISLCIGNAMAEHQALLPRPQQIEYGNGVLPLSRISISFAQRPPAEDRFAAEQLAPRLSATTHSKIAIHNDRANSKSMVLNCAEEGSALHTDH